LALDRPRGWRPELLPPDDIDFTSHLPSDLREAAFREGSLVSHGADTSGFDVTAGIRYVANELALDMQHLESLFYPMAEQIQKNLGLPVSPLAAWAQINTALSSDRRSFTEVARALRSADRFRNA